MATDALRISVFLIAMILGFKTKIWVENKTFVEPSNLHPPVLHKLNAEMKKLQCLRAPYTCQ